MSDVNVDERGAVDAAVRLRDEVDRSLGGYVRRGARVALINYPNHHNVGDPALYLGTLRALRRLGAGVVYACEHSTYSRATLGAKVRRGLDTILINGGGNLGDQYPQQVGRERVLADFPDVPTVQLPQSIWFADPVARDRFAAIVAGHRDLTLMLRDPESLELAKRHFSANSVLAPDMAFGLGPIARPAAPTREIAWLRRVDRESAGAGEIGGAPEVAGAEGPFDWVTVPAEDAVGGAVGRALLRANRRLSSAVERKPYLWRPLWWTFGPLAERRVDFGSRLLAHGRVVVSDRLHGVVLAVLMGIPVVAVDNNTGKVSSLIRTWLSDVPNVHLASGHAAAIELARRLKTG